MKSYFPEQSNGFDPKPKSQKMAVIAGMLILAGSAFFAVSLKINLWGNFKTTSKSVPVQKYSLQNAKILEATSGRVVVKGLAKSPGGQVKELTLILKVDPRTVVKNINVTINEQQAKSGQPFTAVPQILSASISDLIPNTRIAMVRTLEDIFKVNKTRAIEIDYMTQTYIHASTPNVLPLAPTKRPTKK